MRNGASVPARNVKTKDAGGTAPRDPRVDTIKTGIGLLRGAMVLSGFGVSHTECEETGELWLQLISGLGIEGELSEALKNGIPTTKEFQILLLRKLFGEHTVPPSFDEDHRENIKASTKMLYQRYKCSSQDCGAKLVAAMFNEIAGLQGNEKRITEDQVVKGLVSFQNNKRVKGTGKTEEFQKLMGDCGIQLPFTADSVWSNFHSQQTPIFYSAKPSTVIPRDESSPVEDEAKKAELAAYTTPGPQMRSEDLDDDKSKLPYSRGRSGKRSAADRSDDEEYARQMEMMSKGSWAQQTFSGRPPSKVAKNEMKADKEAWTIGPKTSNPDLDLPQGNDNTAAHQSLPPLHTNEGSVSRLSPPNPPGMENCEEDIPASEGSMPPFLELVDSESNSLLGDIHEMTTEGSMPPFLELVDTSLNSAPPPDHFPLTAFEVNLRSRNDPLPDGFGGECAKSLIALIGPQSPSRVGEHSSVPTSSIQSVDLFQGRAEDTGLEPIASPSHATHGPL